MTRKTRGLAARFWEKVDRRGPDECWPWLASVMGVGYGRIGDKRLRCGYSGAHRISLEFKIGRPLLRDELACHTCDNRICVNPAHLFLGDKTSNGLDASAKGRLSPQKHPEKYRAVLARCRAAQAAKRAARVAGVSTGTP